MSDQELERAGEWLDGPIWQEVVRLVYRRQIFRRLIEIYKSAPEVVQESGPDFMRWVMSNYGHAQATVIRKLNDKRAKTQSMSR